VLAIVPINGYWFEPFLGLNNFMMTKVLFSLGNQKKNSVKNHIPFLLLKIKVSSHRIYTESTVEGYLDLYQNLNFNEIV
jgi:hypothetical protein